MQEVPESLVVDDSRSKKRRVSSSGGAVMEASGKQPLAAPASVGGGGGGGGGGAVAVAGGAVAVVVEDQDLPSPTTIPIPAPISASASASASSSRPATPNISSSTLDNNRLAAASASASPLLVPSLVVGFHPSTASSLSSSNNSNTIDPTSLPLQSINTSSLRSNVPSRTSTPVNSYSSSSFDAFSPSTAGLIYDGSNESYLNLSSPRSPLSSIIHSTISRPSSPSIQSSATPPILATVHNDNVQDQSIMNAAAAAASTITPPPPNPSQHNRHSFWDYFKSELQTIDYDSTHEYKQERVQNFLAIPLQMEKLIWLGFLICLDSFLFVFTILPIRFIGAAGSFIAMCVGWPLWWLRESFKSPSSSTTTTSRRRWIKSTEKVDLMKGLLFISCCYFMQTLDASVIYHTVRGQAVLKLYVIFNVLEVCDKLCSAFGHDILDSLFSKAVAAPFSTSPTTIKLSQITHFVVALFYIYAHSTVLFYQVMTLNVAVNSYSNSLLTLLMSNQFVEIKGSVFKKFEKENVFQLSCSDIVERFQLVVFMVLITSRNYMEMTGGGGLIALVSSFYSLSVSIFNSDWSVPSLLSIFSLSVYEQLSRSLFFQSFTAPSSLYHLSTQIYETAMHAFQHLSLLDTIASLVRRFIAMFYTSEYRMLGALLTPALVVVGTEVVVDGLKHAFITKFNQIKPESYTQFRATLMRDLAGKRQWVKRQKASTSSTSSSFTSTTSTTTTNIRASPLPPPPASTSSALDFTTNTTNTTENTTPHVPLHPATPSYSELRLSDRSHTVARRIGFLSLPLACVAVRNLTQTFEVLDLQIFPWKAVLASGGGSGGVRGGSNADIMHWIMGTHYTLAMQVWRLARRILLHSISHSIENSNTHNNTDDLNIFLQGISQLVRDYGIWARVFKVVGLAAFTALIILSVYGILLVVKVSIGIYLHKSALHFLAASEADQERQFQQQQQQQQHIQQQGHSKQVPFTSSAATTTLSSSMCDLKGSSEQSLEEKKLDQIDRYTFIKRII